MSKAEELAEKAYPAWRNGIGDEFNSNSAYYGFIEGYQQAEKDNELTAEQAQMESDFVVQHLKNFNRTPTFIDAIEYGRKMMIDKACEWLDNFYSEDRHCFLVKEDIEAFKQAMEE